MPGPSFACGPSFPNYLLAGGDQAVLGAAELCFSSELGRMNLVPARHKAMPATIPFAEESRDAELADLEVALRKARLATEEGERILSEHATARKQLAAFVAEVKVVEDSRLVVHEDGIVRPGDPTLPWPTMPPIQVTPGLPAEFADYFEGALAWHNPHLASKETSRRCWERLLARPEADRRYKSVWAAFMLGRSWLAEEPERAEVYLRQTRTLASSGFPDPIGMAAASLGIEARLELAQSNYPPAIDLYLEQLAAGDQSAVVSLRFLASRALESGTTTLQRLAANGRSQRVLTAYVLSLPINSHAAWNSDDGEINPSAGPNDLRRKWLRAIEDAGVKDADSAEKFALAAYQANEMDQARRWIKLAPNAPVAQWLQAKLLMRAGKLNEAASLLSKTVHAFPVQPHGTNGMEPVTLKDTLMAGSCETGMIPVERQVLGELGVLRLTRREFTQSLDALLNAGFWMDAAYVAERVLTLEELKAYVDASWPPVAASQTAQEEEAFGGDDVSPAKLREEIRYLLARRLARACRTDEARQYYPQRWLSQLDNFVQLLSAGWDSSRPADQRAMGFFQAAIIARTNGMELIGTEVEPDWRIHDGNFAEGVCVADRSTNGAKVLVASREELDRANAHRPEPDLRFHYRYQAGSLAWEAAKLLPDNSNLTAYVLWRAGSWLKYVDPPTADIFYKSLVNRNRGTVLGAAADRQRWFPVVDDAGNIVPRRPRNVDQPANEDTKTQDGVAGSGDEGNDPDEMNSQNDAVADTDSQGMANEPGTGTDAKATEHLYKYVVQKGDTLPLILNRLAQAGVEVSLDLLLRQNPGLVPAKLKVGQVILVVLAPNGE